MAHFDTQGLCHIRACLRDVFGWFGAGERIEELALEREELGNQLRQAHQLLSQRDHENRVLQERTAPLERENLALHAELETRAEIIEVKDASIDYLVSEKNRLTAYVAHLETHLQNLSPEEIAATEDRALALHQIAQATIERNRRLDFLAGQMAAAAGQTCRPRINLN